MPAEIGDLREAYIDELIEVAQDDPRLVVLDADVSRTSRSRRFRQMTTMTMRADADGPPTSSTVTSVAHRTTASMTTR